MRSDLLEAKRLPDGGFPAERKRYHQNDQVKSGIALVSWGGVSRKRMNEFVTANALTVLRKAKSALSAKTEPARVPSVTARLQRSSATV
jgi:hypothetical protein